ncbi:MAG TPA: TIGR00300 family protein [Nitrospira sp.]|nr:TIGR00300 family protein [Nitrospira sp.]MCE7979015.1 TIGR00300 family protein [Nitrospira sp. NTP1]HQR15888.1 TIGR00300 family protein [Nitrospira sp.]HQV12290.1 TIGR00300 family protein [Nitrospira sp.]
MTALQETVFLQGHIIDSLILAKVLDTILMMGGTFDLQDVTIGATRDAPSQARIVVRAPSSRLLAEILQAIQPHGAAVERDSDCRFEPASAAGIFPDQFYATTHLPTQIRLDGDWVEVEGMEMDLGICVDPAKARARTLPMGSVKPGDLIVTGREGIRVTPLARPRERDVFGFMESVVSSERPHQPVIADIAQRMLKLRVGYRQGQPDTKVLLAGGPAIVHAGGREALTWLIEAGFIHVLFCGNALAAHDMEAALYGTSLGYGLTAGRSVPHGHEHHLRTINRIRAIGSIHEAVRSGVITEGIMAACVRHDVRMVMAGTIRDDGPLPGVVTDSMQAQEAMRAEVQGVGLALLVASTLHAIATGNLLPASVPTVCVDVNPSVPTKLADRGSFQAVGLVMDAASFLKELARELGWRL